MKLAVKILPVVLFLLITIRCKKQDELPFNGVIKDGTYEGASLTYSIKKNPITSVYDTILKSEKALVLKIKFNSYEINPKIATDSFGYCKGDINFRNDSVFLYDICAYEKYKEIFKLKSYQERPVIFTKFKITNDTFLIYEYLRGAIGGPIENNVYSGVWKLKFKI